MTTYSTANSLSPMMFRRDREAGARNARFRSRSCDNALDDVPKEDFKKLRAKAQTQTTPLPESWLDYSDIALVKSVAPVVACLLPPISMDFVCSALLAVGATPLITDGEEAGGPEPSPGRQWASRALVAEPCGVQWRPLPFLSSRRVCLLSCRLFCVWVLVLGVTLLGAC